MQKHSTWKLKISKLRLEIHMIFSNNEPINHRDISLEDLLTSPRDQLCFPLANVLVLMQKSWWIRVPNTAKNHFGIKSCEFIQYDIY